MREKGFTLVELLGVIVILSIIMLIAIPNVMSTLENSKRQRYLADAKQLITQVQYELRTNIEKPNSNQLLKITLGDLGTSDIEKDPDGDPYSLTDSYVVVARVDGYLKYYVNLIAPKGAGKNKGIKLTFEDNLEADNKLTLITNNITALTDANIKSQICSSCTLLTMSEHGRLKFNNQSKAISITNSVQTFTITGASGGSGSYTYSEVSEKVRYKKGDINKDGIIDDADSSYIQELQAGTRTYPESDLLLIADIDDDGQVNSRDKKHIFNYLSGLTSLVTGEEIETNTSYFSISNNRITVQANVPSGKYIYTIRAKDTSTNVTQDAIITINVTRNN